MIPVCFFVTREDFIPSSLVVGAWKSKLWGSDNRRDWLLSAQEWLKMCLLLVHSLFSWIENETTQSLLCKCMDLVLVFFCLNLCGCVQTNFISSLLLKMLCKEKVSLFSPLKSDPLYSSILDITSLQKAVSNNFFRGRWFLVSFYNLWFSLIKQWQSASSRSWNAVFLRQQMCGELPYTL